MGQLERLGAEDEVADWEVDRGERERGRQGDRAEQGLVREGVPLEHGGEGTRVEDVPELGKDQRREGQCFGVAKGPTLLECSCNRQR